ncbi:MAG: winged helix-turn-helix transcriptional regulator [Duodenibacillus sp.]
MPCCCSHSEPAAAQEPLCCPVQTTLNLIGGKYKTLIVWNLFGRTLRFSELQRAIPHATAKMLTQQLRELERDGLLQRTVYAQVPPKVEYSLTASGNSLEPILKSIYAWGAAYLEAKGMKANCGMRSSGRN